MYSLTTVAMAYIIVRGTYALAYTNNHSHRGKHKMKYTPRVFSINLAAYLLMTTELQPEYGTDEETGSTYFVFPEVAAVKIAIAEFPLWQTTN